MNKIVFLDIDGVLNSISWNNKHQNEIRKGELISEEKVKLLARLVKRTGAKIILHSGWRFWFDDDIKPLRKEAVKLVKLLKEESVYIAGKTPDLTTEEIRKTKKFSIVKADEIFLWLRMNTDIENWVVLDDIDLKHKNIKEHQILINPNLGLTQKDIGDAEKILLDSRVSFNIN
jgi:hypothetical protein